MRITVTIRALAIPETIPHSLVAASQAFLRMTGHALELFVRAFERIVRELRVIECLDLECRGDVTGAALTLRRSKPELPGVNVAVATRAIARCAAVRGAFAARAVLLRGAMTTVASRFSVRAGKRPRAVIDARRIPAARGVAMGASVLAHLRCELISVRVLMAVDALLRVQLEVVVGAFALMTGRAGHRLVSAIERELGASVLLHGEQGRPESLLVVARLAIDGAEAAPMHVSMTVGALSEFQLTVASLHWQLGRVAAPARDVSMQALQREVGERMSPQPDLLRQPRPTDARMAVLASIAEPRLVHLGMAGHAVRARGRSRSVPIVMTRFTLRLRVAPGEAQSRMIRPYVGDLAPVAFVVARSAFLPGEPSFVWVLMAGHTLGLQPEIGRVPAPIPLVVTVLASHRGMGALELPTRLAMVEARRGAARPPHQPGIPSEVLHVTSPAVLSSVLAAVQARLLPYPGRQIVVASKACVGVEPLARRMTLAAIRVAIDLGVRRAELSGRQKLGAGLPWHERSANRCHNHHAAQDRERRGAALHSEKIQRYP